MTLNQQFTKFYRYDIPSRYPMARVTMDFQGQLEQDMGAITAFLLSNGKWQSVSKVRYADQYRIVADIDLIDAVSLSIELILNSDHVVGYTVKR